MTSTTGFTNDKEKHMSLRTILTTGLALFSLGAGLASVAPAAASADGRTTGSGGVGPAYLVPPPGAPVPVRANSGITIGYNRWINESGCNPNVKFEVSAYLRTGRVDRTGVYMKNVDVTFHGTREGGWGDLQIQPGNGGHMMAVPFSGWKPNRTITRNLRIERWVPAGSRPIYLSIPVEISANPDGCGGSAVATFHIRPNV